MIDTAIGGMKTRFIKDGKNPTLLILASSKRSEKSFLEEHIKRKLANDHENSLIVDQPVWNVKPKGTYSEKTFRVALGNKFLQSQIIPDDNTEDWVEKGFSVINVPIDFRTDFSDDIDRALCDFAGISSSEINKYISAGAINDVITNKRKNPFTREILEIGNAPDDYQQYYDSFDLSQIPQELKYKPLYIHMDMSISGDKTGIVGTWISGKKTSIDSLSQSKDLYYTVAFAVAIKAPKGRQVSFEKNRNFIYWLKEQGFNIKGITTDTFQSYDTGQALSAKGYNYSILSVDRVTNNICIPYQYLKSTIYEKRIDIFEMNLLRGELIDLERNINTGKVDHPVSCFTGDTKIRLVDGRSVSINDLMIEQEYKQNWVYTFNEQTKKIEPKKIKHVFQSGITKNLVKVTLDNGEVITCTPEHLFMLRDGSYEEIQNLTPGAQLMSFLEGADRCIDYIEFITKQCSVYDLEIEDNHNFSLDAGVIVHNSSKDVADALCLDGSTEIFLLSGKNRTISDLYENGWESEWVLSYDIETSKLKPIPIESVIDNGVKDNIVKLTLDNGESVICTDDHLILCRDGKYIEAGNSLGYSLMPFSYEQRFMYKDRDYTYVYNPNDDGSTSGIYLHKLVAESEHSHDKELKLASKYESEFVVIHHKDCNRKNNNPDNLEYLTNTEHSNAHVMLNSNELKRNQLSAAAKRQVEKGEHPFQLMSKEQRAEIGRRSLTKLNKSDKHRAAVSLNCKLLASKGEFIFQQQWVKDKACSDEANAKRTATCRVRYGANSPFESQAIQDKMKKSCLDKNGYDNPFHSKEKQHDMVISKIKNLAKKVYDYYGLSYDEQISYSDYVIAQYILGSSASFKKEHLMEAGINIADFDDFNYDEYVRLRNKGSIVKLFIKSTGKESFTYEEFSSWYHEMFNTNEKFRHRVGKISNIPSYSDIVKLGFKLKNHRVVKIERLDSRHVYDIKLGDVHNFALTSGIIVHNCGSVYNASLAAEEYAFEYGENMNTAADFNVDVDPISDYINNFEESIKQSHNTQTNYHEGPQEVFIPSSDILFW